jgi:serine/threonine-protein kinase
VQGQTRCDACQGLTPTEPIAVLRGVKVAGFRLALQLGAGRFSTSWQAAGVDGSAVVVKLLRAYAADAATVRSFLAEAHRLARSRELEHPAVAPLITGGVQLAGALFLVYGKRGEATLADELRARGRLPILIALELGAQIAEGLAALHRAGIYHLDLKPANVAMESLADGGVRAWLLDGATAHLLTTSGLEETPPPPLSTAAYLSPEETGSGPVDERADLYALGALLFQCISGRLPVLGSTVEELTRAHREQPPLKLREVGRRLPVELEVALGRALHKDPAQRFRSGDEMAAVLRALLPAAGRVAAAAEAAEEAAEEEEQAAAAVAVAARAALDPDLERALLGEGFPESEPAFPRRAWLRPAIAATVAAVLLAGGVALFRRRPAPVPKAPTPQVATIAPLPVVPPPPPPPANEPDASESPARARLRRAQLQLAAGDARGAERTLRPLLSRKGLPRRDQSQALRLMGSAEARRGRKQSAVEWYRKSLRLTDDAAERERVVRLIQHLAH